MKTYKPYRHQLRRSLFASTIFPVFMVMIIGLISFYAIYIWIEHRTIHQHTYQTQAELQRIDKHFHTFVTQQQKQWRHVDLTKSTDITTMKRQLLKKVTQQPATLYYDLKGASQSFTNNYEHLDTTKMYLLSKYRVNFKDSAYTLKIYMSNTPQLKYIKKDSGQSALIIDAYDTILYTNDDRFSVGQKYQPPQFGFMNESLKLNSHHAHLIIYKDIHETIEDGIALLVVMGVVLIMLVIFGYISADRMAKRQSEDIEAIVRKIDDAKNRHLGSYEPLKKNSELEEINNYIYDLFESNEQLIQSIEQTERRLRDIQLKEIERQFQPHFLFNTMQTIQYLIPLSPKVAQTVIQQLSQMLRYSLRTAWHTVKLAEELSYIEQYVAIQNIRFDDMIQLYIDAPEGVQHQTIGKMMLQPLVENAIKHGRDSEPLKITIRIRLTKRKLHILVHDNGIGMSPSHLEHVRQSLHHDVFDTTHLGLNHLHNRAMIQYGTYARLHIFSRSQQGTLMCYQIPLV
ncbi:sensor histidine kinase [Staphylococcus epidermidis]|uniref:sensor histidine kinase n=1 Tax=Staphylococcus epidermidis TaxID=1282 RepID=UPI00138E4132|nr:sensor histidine kinase [Staphylococcus epidermidis]MDS3928931.1 sensor histidine kinase [Staphylococcus epidermidis]